MATVHRVYDVLVEMKQTLGLDPVKQLFWVELNYDRANRDLSMRGWPDSAIEALVKPPTLLATAGGELEGFNVIYCRLDGDLLITPQRPVIRQLLKEFPYSLFIFSDEEQRRWHFVNVKYDKEEKSRRLFRRITIGPDERLRTAAERIALLDVANISHDLFGVSPLAVQTRHDEAFDVEAVTRDFFRDYRSIFEETEDTIEGIGDDEQRRLFTQKLFNRIMFIVFLERKGWLTFNGESGEYLLALWRDYERRRKELAEDNFYTNRLRLLFFAGLNSPHNINLMNGFDDENFIQTRIGSMPYLNGGLFEESGLDLETVHVPDKVIGRAIENLFYRYNFTITESTPLDVEVAVDPEMLGKIFEELVTGRHESGSYYTPKSIVSFMGRESLKGYLQDACNDESPRAIEAFIESQPPDPGQLHDPESVLDALRQVMICDPACGSGAYLLGMLQELMRLRDGLFRGERKLDDITGYQRKLEIIQKNLYGVDIDPFAVNIARLRLWLSLIVDFDGPREEVPPLPNLDFQIESGDSLLGPDPSGGLQPDLVRHQQITEYKNLKSEYLKSHGNEKKRLYGQILNLRKEITEWIRGTSKAEGFDWAVEFAEVFIDPDQAWGGGFDIVITNPPYVRQELIRDIKPTLRQIYGDLYSGTADLYVFFYYRALQMLRPGGMLCFISSNKWMRAGYGEKLRKHLTEATIVQTIVDFGDLPIFTATAYPCVVVVQKGSAPEDHTLTTLVVTDYAVVERVADEVQEEAWPQPQNSLRSDGWALVQPDILALIRKLRRNGTPLGEYVEGQFYYGIKTGRNAAFVIDEATRAQLIDEDPRSAEVIKPWLRGRDVKRWSVEWDGLYVIYVQNSGDSNANNPWSHAATEAKARTIFKATYPAIHDHLSQDEDALRKRYDQGQFWWELRACAYYAEFEKPKIIVPAIVQSASYSLDIEGYYSNDKTTIIVGDYIEYLAGLLNSNVLEYFMHSIASSKQNDYFEYKPMYLEQLPIPNPTLDQRTAIEDIVRRLLDLNGEGPEVPQLEVELNALVYEVYGLTAKEIALIERELEIDSVHQASDFLDTLSAIKEDKD